MTTVPEEKAAGPGDASPESAPLAVRDLDQNVVWPAGTLSLPREALLIFVVCMAQFCTQSAYMGTLVLLRKIGASFGVAEPARLAWLIGGYSLTVGTLILFSGRLGDIFGYRRLLIIGFAWFSLWSMVAGLSAYSNFTLAVFSRVLQGIGPAICLPNAIAILGVAYPPGHRKAMVFAFLGAVAPIGGVGGAAVAAAFDLIWWPWALWAMAIWLAILAVVTRFAVPDLPGNGPLPIGWKPWVEALDLYSAVVGVVALILFNFAFTQSAIAGWAQPVILVPLIAGLALFAVFIFVEFRYSARPLLPIGIDASFPAATLIVSDAVAKEHQGVGASLVNTVVNYGIALGVGFAGTVEVHVRGDSAERGYYAAMWMGVGLAAFGMVISVIFVARDHVLERKRLTQGAGRRAVDG